MKLWWMWSKSIKVHHKMRPRQNLRVMMNLIQTHHKTMQLSTPLCKKMTMKTNAIPAQVNVGHVPLWTTQPKKKHHDPNKDWDTMSTSNWHWNDINYIILYTVITYFWHNIKISKQPFAKGVPHLRVSLRFLFKIKAFHCRWDFQPPSQSFTDPGAPPPFPNMVRHGIGHLNPNTGNHRNRISPLEFAMSKFLFNFVF